MLKPFDVFGFYKDKLNNINWFAREFKYIDTKTINYRSAYKKLEPHQIINLSVLSRMWIESLVIAYHKHTNQFYIYNFEILWTKSCEENLLSVIEIS